MSHVELPIYSGGHITLVHFPASLTAEQAQVVLEGMEAVGKMGVDLELRWLQEVRMGKYNTVRARLLDDKHEVLHKMRDRLARGLASRGIAYSDDYSGWTPHVSRAHPGEVNWSIMHHLPKLVLVQKPHRIEVPF